MENRKNTAVNTNYAGLIDFLLRIYSSVSLSTTWIHVRKMQHKYKSSEECSWCYKYLLWNVKYERNKECLDMNGAEISSYKENFSMFFTH